MVVSMKSTFWVHIFDLRGDVYLNPGDLGPKETWDPSCLSKYKTYYVYNLHISLKTK